MIRLLDQLQALLPIRNVLLVRLYVIGLQAFLCQPVAVGVHLAFGRAHFLLHVANRVNQALPRPLRHVQTPNLVGDLDAQPAGFAAQSQKLSGFLAAGNLLFRAELDPFFQRVLEQAANVLDPFDRPLAILFGLVLFAGEFGLLRKGNHLADVDNAGGQLFADLQQFADGNRRAGDCFLGFDLAAFDAFRDGHFAFASQQRHHAHFAQVKPHRVVGFFQRARGKIQLEFIVTRFFVVRGDRGGLLDQPLVGIRHVNV